MSDSLVAVTRDGAVATVRLDHPPVNALSNALLEQLQVELELLAIDDSVRAVIVTGSGEKAFAAGAKLPELLTIMEDGAEIERHTALTRTVLGLLSDLPQPTIAAVQATAVGGGFELVLACDLAVVDERARLGLPEVGLGLIPGAGGTQRLTRRVGAARATELILTGRLLHAHEAERLGAITHVAPAGQGMTLAEEVARAIAAQPVRAARAAKRAIRGGLDATLGDGLDQEHDAFVGVLSSADAREGVTAFIGRRPPVFVHD